MSEEEKRTGAEPGDFEYHPFLQQLSKKKTSKGKSRVKAVIWSVIGAGLIGGWLFLVYREPPEPKEAEPLSAVNELDVQTPAPEDILNNPEFQKALQMSEEQMELDRIAERFVEVEDYRWKKVGWRVQKIRDIDAGIALGKDVEDFRDVTGTIMETRVSDEDGNGLWDIGVQYARLLGLDIKDPENEHKIALIAVYVNNENLLIEFEKFSKKEFDPHRVAPGTLIRFRPLDDSRLEVLFTDWHQVIDRQI